VGISLAKEVGKILAIIPFQLVILAGDLQKLLHKRFLVEVNIRNS
jgi:hypothetical protein